MDPEDPEDPAASEAVASGEVEVEVVSEVVSRAEEVVVDLRVETDLRSEEAVGPEAVSDSREVTEALMAMAAGDIMGVKPHRMHQQDPADAEEAVGMAAATTEVPAEATRVAAVGMAVIEVAAATTVVAAQGMTGTAAVGVEVAAEVIGMVIVTVAEGAEGLVDTEATTIGVEDPTATEGLTVIEVHMVIGVLMAIEVVMIEVATVGMMGIRGNEPTMAAMEGMVVATGIGEGISSVMC